jgi:hypothetical protein
MTCRYSGGAGIVLLLLIRLMERRYIRGEDVLWSILHKAIDSRALMGIFSVHP